jgi:hypothetical protein
LSCTFAIGLVFDSVFCAQIACKITTKIWNKQGFVAKKANLFGFSTTKPCYSHKGANSFWGPVQQAVSESTANF